jgi:hypothetical protein
MKATALLVPLLLFISAFSGCIYDGAYSKLAGGEADNEADYEDGYEQAPPVLSQDGPVYEKKKWTFMLYDDADFENAYNALDDFKWDAYSCSNAHVAVLEDTYGGPSTTYRLNELHLLETMADNGEVNMGDYAVLRDFVAYCKKHFPAERYMLWMYDHGGGWMGACVDDSSNGDILTMVEMRRAFEEAGKIDVLCFSAPCLMGAIESAYELRGLVDVYVGSEDLSGYMFWMRVAADVCGILDTDPGIASLDLGKKIVEAIQSRLDFPLMNPYLLLLPDAYSTYTISAIDVSKTEAAAKAVKNAVEYVLGDVESHAGIVSRALENREAYADFSMDAIQFAETMCALDGNNEQTKSMAEKIGDAVVANICGSERQSSHGLSIFLPDPSVWGENMQWVIDKYSETSGIAFAGDSGWGEFLQTYLGTEEHEGEQGEASGYSEEFIRQTALAAIYQKWEEVYG